MAHLKLKLKELENVCEGLEEQINAQRVRENQLTVKASETFTAIFFLFVNGKVY